MADTKVKETKAPISFEEKIDNEMQKRKKDLKLEDLQKMEKRSVVLELKESSATKQKYVQVSIYVDPRYENGILSPKKRFTLQEFDLCWAQNGLEKSNHLVLNCPVRFFDGISKVDDKPYTRMDVFFAKDVYRSVFVDYRVKLMLDYLKIELNTTPDFISQEGTEGLTVPEGADVIWS